LRSSQAGWLAKRWLRASNRELPGDIFAVTLCSQFSPCLLPSNWTLSNPGRGPAASASQKFGQYLYNAPKPRIAQKIFDYGLIQGWRAGIWQPASTRGRKLAQVDREVILQQKQLTTTTQLVRDYRDGNQDALNTLYSRYMPLLRRWASGRLPAHGRNVSETEDLVQVAFTRAFKRLDKFESERPGAFLAYLRTILMNLIRDELRRSMARPQLLSMTHSFQDSGASIVEAAVGAETLEQYERAILQLPEDKRHAVMMRVEFDLTYEEIAEELNLPSANATRMMISRALVELADKMSE
jgi:RNA polymerase sigma-70 factor (ECF subfamily)